MSQALPKIVTFNEFIAWYPENSGVRYELHNGEIVEMGQPTGKHAQYSFSQDFSLNRQHNELYDVLRVLHQLSRVGLS